MAAAVGLGKAAGLGGGGGALGPLPGLPPEDCAGVPAPSTAADLLLPDEARGGGAACGSCSSGPGEAGGAGDLRGRPLGLAGAVDDRPSPPSAASPWAARQLNGGRWSHCKDIEVVQREDVARVAPPQEAQRSGTTARSISGPVAEKWDKCELRSFFLFAGAQRSPTSDSPFSAASSFSLASAPGGV